MTIDYTFDLGDLGTSEGFAVGTVLKDEHGYLDTRITAAYAPLTDPAGKTLLWPVLGMLSESCKIDIREKLEDKFQNTRWDEVV